MLFLQMEVLSEERIAMAVSGFGLNDEQVTVHDKSRKKGKAEFKDVATAAGLFSTKDDKPTCLFCEQIHESASCTKAKKMSREEKNRIVKEKNACFQCLKLGHGFRFCNYKGKCAWCGKRHILLMCRNVSQGTHTEKKQTEESRKTQEQPNLANVSLACEVFLQTLRVKLYNHGKEKVVRAILDTDSHKTYILDKYAEEMDFDIVGEQTVVHMLFGGSKSKPQVPKDTKFLSRV